MHVVILHHCLSHCVKKNLFCMFRCCRLVGSPTTRPVFAVWSADRVWRVSPSLWTQTTECTVSATTTSECLIQNNNNEPSPLIHTPDKRWNQTLPDRLNEMITPRVTSLLSFCDLLMRLLVVSGSELLCVLHAERRYCQPRSAEMVV